MSEKMTYALMALCLVVLPVAVPALAEWLL